MADPSTTARVVVVGGGVAGLSAAHELAERGYRVSLHERGPTFGGKARTVPVPASAAGARPELPGEHGFRFFPRFYRHVTDTMSRIPYGGSPRGVLDNLVDTTRVDMASFGRPSLVLPDRLPDSVDDLRAVVAAWFAAPEAVELEPGELEFFADRLWQLLTSCMERRFAEYETIGWWEYIGAATRSSAYQKFFAAGLTRSIVAARPQQSNAMATGDILVQLLLGMTGRGTSTDRVLCGPTTEVWIAPWVDHLTSLGVELHPSSELTGIELQEGRVAALRFRDDAGGITREPAGQAVIALPVEGVARVLRRKENAPVLEAAPALRSLFGLATNVAWMNGIQFFLRRDVRITRGHCLLLDSPWALTAISQPQFWPGFPLSGYGDGRAKGLLSVDISDWDSPGLLHGRSARQSTRAEIAAEVWHELKLAFNVERVLLRDADVLEWFLDPDIEDVVPAERDRYRDAEPLFLSIADTWRLRPDAATEVPNLFLAGDYVRTDVQIPCMEAANLSARLAVNALLASTSSQAGPCPVWALREPAILAAWRWHDRLRFELGLPWSGYIPLPVTLVHRLLHALLTACGAGPGPASSPPAGAASMPSGLPDDRSHVLGEADGDA